MGLTADAQKAIDDAIAIVRSDKVHEYIRRSSKPAEPATGNPPTGGPSAAAPPSPAPPPAPTDGPPSGGPPADPPAPTKSAYWGELLDD